MFQTCLVVCPRCLPIVRAICTEPVVHKPRIVDDAAASKPVPLLLRPLQVPTGRLPQNRFMRVQLHSGRQKQFVRAETG